MTTPAKIKDTPPENLDDRIAFAEKQAAALASERKTIQRQLTTELAGGHEQKGRALRADLARINDEITFQEQTLAAMLERREAETADAAKADLEAKLAALVKLADKRILVGRHVEAAVGTLAARIHELDGLSRELDSGVLALPVADRPTLRNTVDDTRTGIPYNLIAAGLHRMVPNAEANMPTAGLTLGDRLLAARQNLANHNAS